MLTGDNFSYALGAKGSTRRKLAAASGCIIEYVGKLACFARPPAPEGSRRRAPADARRAAGRLQEGPPPRQGLPPLAHRAARVARVRIVVRRQLRTFY
jgi:hypothetical protein